LFSSERRFGPTPAAAFILPPLYEPAINPGVASRLACVVVLA